MTANNTLLAHLARWFPSGSENAATDALAHILNRSPHARAALDDLIRSGVQNVASVVSVQPQRARDGTIPDLVGMDEADKERVLIEVKFWADLTDKQPNAYLDRLPKNGAAVLLFLVPDDRVRRLWPELRKRAKPKLLDVVAERKCMKVPDSDRYLMVAGWTSLLDCMASRTRDAGELGIEADIRQLRGLAEYAEGETVPPDDRRKVHLRRLIDSATERGEHAGWLNTTHLGPSRRRGDYGRYIRFSMSGVASWFGVADDRYKKGGETPLWLRFRPATRTKKVGLIKPLQFDALRDRSRLQGKTYGWVPLTLKPDVERSEEIDHVVDQLVRISEVIDNPE